MLVEMTGQQVANYWIDMIKPAVANSLPAHVTLAEDTMNNILNKILCGVVQCWAVTLEGNIVGICTTMINVDPVTGSKSFLIYSLYNFTDEMYPDHLWATCLDQVMRLAKSKDCWPVYCYTDNEQVAKHAVQVGGASTQQLITFG